MTASWRSAASTTRAVPWEALSARLLPSAAFIAVLVLIWWLIVSVFSIPEYIVPTPLQVWQALVGRGWDFLPDVWTTTQEVLAGFGVGLVVGGGLAPAVALLPSVRDAVYPVLIFSQVVPIFVVSVVVTIVFVNDGLLPQIAVTALYSFLPLVVTGADGLSRVDPDLVRLLRAGGASEWRIFRMARVPSALPALFSGAKLAMIFAVGAAAISEWIGGGSGLGYYMRNENDSFLVPQVFAGAIVLSALGAALFALVAATEYFAVPWNRGRRDKRTIWKG